MDITQRPASVAAPQAAASVVAPRTAARDSHARTEGGGGNKGVKARPHTIPIARVTTNLTKMIALVHNNFGE